MAYEAEYESAATVTAAGHHQYRDVPVLKRADMVLFWRVLAIASVLASLGLHILLASTAKTPSFPFDEITLLQYAKYVSGTGIDGPLGGAGYFPAWSFVLAPLWWITSDAAVFYHLAIGLGVVVAMGTIWPLACVTQRFEVSREQSVVVAALVMCMPSRTVQAAYALSEKFLFLVLVCLVLAAYRLWEKMTMPRMALFVLLVPLTVMTHARALAVLPVCVFWLLFLMKRDWRVAGLGAVSAGALGFAAYQYCLWLNGRLLEKSFVQGANLTDNLQTCLSVFARIILGQAWYQVVSSLGIVIIGVAVLLITMVKELRECHTLGVSAWLLMLIGAISALSVLSWAYEDALYSTGRGRLDPVIYGRYNDPFTAIAVAIGLAAIFKVVSTRVLCWSAVAGLAIIIPTVYWVAPTVATWGVVTPAHIPGILPWQSTLPFAQTTSPGWALSEENYRTWDWMTPTLTNENRFWLIASLTVILFWVLLIVLRRLPILIALTVLIATCVGSVLSYPMVELFQRKDGGKPEIVSVVEALENRYGEIPVRFDKQCRPNPGNGAWAQNVFMFWLQSGDFEFVDSYSADLGDGLVIGCPNFPESASLAATRVGDVSSIGFDLWVLPGDLQDQLSVDGFTERAALFADRLEAPNKVEGVT